MSKLPIFVHTFPTSDPVATAAAKVMVKNTTARRGLAQVRCNKVLTIKKRCISQLTVSFWVKDIREATRDTVRHMITFLEAEHGLTRVEAYMLCSVAGDLKMHEVVSGSLILDSMDEQVFMSFFRLICLTM